MPAGRASLAVHASQATQMRTSSRFMSVLSMSAPSVNLERDVVPWHREFPAAACANAAWQPGPAAYTARVSWERCFLLPCTTSPATSRRGGTAHGTDGAGKDALDKPLHAVRRWLAMARPKRLAPRLLAAV